MEEWQVRPLPEEFRRRMDRLLGGEAGREFLEAYASAPLRRGLRVNTLKVGIDRFQTLFPLALEPIPFSPAGFSLPSPHRAGADPLHHAGAYYMQEASAMSAVTVLSPLPGERILDLCAAPGGKTILLAEQMQGTGELYSCDAAENRVGLIRTAVDRMGFTGVHTLCNNATKPNPALPMADRILTDVPCSGLGILAKKPDLRYKKLEAARQAELLATQAAILDTAAALLKAGGRLVYSTCTIDPAENQQQIAAFLQRHPEFAVCAPEVPLPAGMTAGEHGCLSVPTRTGMDGFFLCVLQKAAATQ